MIGNILVLSEISLLLISLIAAATIIGLWIGSEIAVFGARALANKLGLSELIVGLTILSIISSLPEISVNIAAGLDGVDDVAAGNVVGSCFVQISLVLGLCVLIAGKISGKRSLILRDGIILLAANLSFILLALDGQFSAQEGSVLVVSYALYLIFIVWLALKEQASNTGLPEAEGVNSYFHDNAFIQIGLIIFGSGLIWVMADILVEVGTNAGQRLGISEGVIGLWTGVGTSIPELAIALLAALRGASGLSIGNLVGSNITDPLLSLGLGAVAADGLNVSHFIATTAAGVWFASTLFIVLTALIRKGLSRTPAAIMVVAYLISQYWFVISS